MKTHRFDFVIYAGADLYVPFKITLNGTVLNLATQGDGYDVGRLTVKDTTNGDVQLNLTTDDDTVSLTYFTDSSGTWSGYWQASAAVTRELVDWGDGQYELVICDGEEEEPATHVEKPFVGFCTLSPRIAP